MGSGESGVNKECSTSEGPDFKSSFRAQFGNEASIFDKF